MVLRQQLTQSLLKLGLFRQILKAGGAGRGLGRFRHRQIAQRALVEKNEFARPRLAISHSGKDAQLLGAVRLALQSAETALA